MTAISPLKLLILGGGAVVQEYYLPALQAFGWSERVIRSLLVRGARIEHAAEPPRFGRNCADWPRGRAFEKHMLHQMRQARHLVGFVEISGLDISCHRHERR